MCNFSIVGWGKGGDVVGRDGKDLCFCSPFLGFGTRQLARGLTLDSPDVGRCNDLALIRDIVSPARPLLRREKMGGERLSASATVLPGVRDYR